MLRRLQRRPGAVAVLVALCLVAMLAIVALAIDGGLILDQRRRLQSAADAAALAAAIDLYLNNPTSTAKATALSIAASNGYNNDGKTNTVTVNIPPQSANVPAVYKGSGFVEVLITYTPQSYFSGIFNLIPPGITATPPPTQAVARGKLASFGGAILLLDPKGSGALSAAGNAGITVANGPIIVDSNSSSAATLAGNAVVTAPTVDLGGSPGYSLAGNAEFGKGTTVLSGQSPTSDPLASIAEPNPSSLTLQSSSTLNISGNQTVTLNPGVYKGGISISGNANVTMNSGANPIYYMEGGGFSIAGNGNLTANGVMIFNDNGGGSIDIAGNGKVTISPPASGTYQGISIFQDRNTSNTVTVAGNGSMNISGTFYAAAATLKVSGNGDTIGSQYISYDLQVAGNGTVNLPYSASTSAKTRQYGLVQ